MTDSMKFGPEWLRNMSTDTANPGLLGSCNVGGGNSLSSSNNMSTSNSNGSSVGGSGQNTNNSNADIVVTVIHTPRNMFPEFRYGREEMLSLFDKNCNIPEILPSYRKIFVEKVQFPLALTPSTDEELLMQGPVLTTQRPSWIQRSPIAFSSSQRGSGRGGSVDRGRMRGKAIYHPIYQRPTAMFEDDIRASIKSERNWPERNGVGGDSMGGSSSSVGVGVSGMTSDWNGTPTSSPRKELSSHSRNMENWRRNRSEDGNGVSGGGSGSGTSSDGWRGGSNVNSFGSTHRWGRSTSWRDDEIASINTDSSGGYVNSSGIAMQRSYSTMSTSATERSGGSGVYSSGTNLSKNSQNSNFQSGNHSTGRLIGSITSTRSKQWSSILNISGGTTRGVDGEENLPEWAMENPSNGGGTFDASGAFHGSVEEDDAVLTTNDKSIKDNIVESPKKQSNESSCTSIDDKCNIQPKQTNNFKTDKQLDAKNAITTLEEDNDKCNKSHTEITKSDVSTKKLPDEEQIQLQANSLGSVTIKGSGVMTGIQNCERANSIANIVTCPSPSLESSASSTAGTNYNIPLSGNHSNCPTQNTHVNDFSDRMKEVADDMVEKLIMDDDPMVVGMNDTNTETGSESTAHSSINAEAITTGVSSGGGDSGAVMHVDSVGVSSAVLTMLKPTNIIAHHQSSGIVTNVQNVVVSTVSPPTLPLTMTTVNSSANVTVTGHEATLPLYGSGVVVDHGTMQQQQHLQKQQQLAAAVCLPQTINTSSADIWYYRDPQSKVQGPFTALEMTDWYRAGYFGEDLFVRRLVDKRFRALGELIKICHGNMPFTHSHLIPLSLDNIHIPNTPGAAAQLHEKPQILLNDFGLNSKQQQQQENEQREELKANVTAAADSLFAAIKSISSMDMQHMLHMHLQMLQEQYLRHQERFIVTELSKNEYFQHLTSSEQEGVIRQKVQMLVLPEYLTSLNGLSNALAALNPAAGNQLYDAIVERSKKDHIFSATGGGTTAQQQHQLNSVNSFLEADHFILSAQQQQLQSQQQHQPQFPGGAGPYGGVIGSESNTLTSGKNDMSGNELLSEFNLRMFLRSTGEPELISQQQQQKNLDFIGTNNTTSPEFLTEQQVLAAVASPNPMMQMWLPPLGAAAQTNAPRQQQPQNSQWAAGGPLVGIPSAMISSGSNFPGQQTKLTSSMWDCASIVQEHQQLAHQQPLEHNSGNFDDQQKMQISLENSLHSKDQQKSLEHKEIIDVVADSQKKMPSPNHQMDAFSSQSSVGNKQRKDDKIEKQLQNLNKRNNSKQQQSVIKGKDESSLINSSNNANINRKSEEERRREIAEEKRRQKEEKKRQQIEEEKRRIQQLEDEKRRQMQEEKERQQQIQAQRRKAMLGNNGNSSNSTSNAPLSVTVQVPSAIVKTYKHIQSSIAPWSTQSSSKSGPPCLAEIQKAERRERRADQQRQMEILEKQMRANAVAAAEANDSMLKWNPSPVPVKNLAEIQAEEAKRLAAEQLDMQRRKDFEGHQASATVVSLSNVTLSGASITNTTSVGNNTAGGNAPAIWGSTKVWGSTNTSGFWEEPIKFSAALTSNLNVNTAATTVGASSLINNSNGGSGKHQVQIVQQKSISLSSNSQKTSSANTGATSRSLRKSQTVSIMQNTVATTTATTNKNTKMNNQQNSAACANRPKIKTLLQNINDGIKKNSNGTLTKYQGQNYNKKDDFEHEFNGWCTKSLNNMNTKVDVPTFVTFLQDLESPYEVKDYIRMYLGESKEYTEFAKQFLERRSKYKNLQRAQNAHNDDMCKPAPAITPSGNDSSDNKGKQKKIKKNKMTKLDGRILGFSVTAAEGRVNVGDLDYVDAP